MFCRQQAAALMGIKAKTEGMNIAIVIIGSGTPGQAKAFVGITGYNGELYVNEDLKAYQAFDLERGFFKTLGPRSLIKGVKAIGQGFHQGLNAGDLWQQGGLFVLGPGDKLSFSHVDRFAGDHPDPEDVVKACLL